MKGKLFVFCGVVLIALAVLLIAHKAAGAEVEIASLDSGKPCTWQRDVEAVGATEETRTAKAPETSGRTIQLPEPALSYLRNDATDSINLAASWNFANWPKDGTKLSFDIGKDATYDLYFGAISYNLGSLADIIDFPMVAWINPRIGGYAGWDVPGDKVRANWFATLVQVSW